MKYHTHLLTLKGDGSGGWTLSQVGSTEERMGIDREIGILKGKLAEVEKWEARVKELDRLLGIVDIDNDRELDEAVEGEGVRVS